MITTDSETQAYIDIIMRSNYYHGELARLLFIGEGKEERAKVILTPFIGREINIASVTVETPIDNVGGRGIRMDVVATDEHGNTFDVELQRDPSGAHPHRARFNSAVIDAHYPLKGIDTNELRLPETYVLFFTEKDYFKKGKAFYPVERMITNIGEPFNDGSHIIYVNGEYDDTSTSAGQIIHDLRCASASEMVVPEIASQTRWLKETEEGYRMVSKEEQEILDRVYYRGQQIGRFESFCDLVASGDLDAGVASKKMNMPLAVFMEKMAEYNSGRANA